MAEIVSKSQVRGFFPSALSKDESKFTSEKNITGIIKSVVDNASYIISYNQPTCEFVINGYYFKLDLPQGYSNQWAYIITDSSNRLIGYDIGNSTVTTEIYSEGDTPEFRGVIFSSSGSENFITQGYEQFKLQLIKDGVINYDAFRKFNYSSMPEAINIYIPNNPNPISGQGVADALSALSASNPSGLGFISSISQENGLISTTRTAFSVSNSITSGTSSVGPKVSTTINGVSSTAQEINKASTSIFGVTKLSSDTSSTATDVAATPKMISDIKSSLESRISTLETDVSGDGSSISSLNSRVTTIENNYFTKPSGTAAPGKVIKKYSETTNYGWDTLGAIVVSAAVDGDNGKRNGSNIPNGNVRLNLHDNYNVLSSTNIVGSGIVSVTGNNGIITINAPSPNIPTVNNSTITIQTNGTNVDNFTTNASSNKTINITFPKITYGTSLPASSSGSNGDVFILI